MGFLIIWMLCAFAAAIIAVAKGRSGIGWFLLGCLIGIFAVLIVGFLPGKTDRFTERALERERRARKVCPECAEEVMLQAKVCKHCGYRFEPASLTAR